MLFIRYISLFIYFDFPNLIINKMFNVYGLLYKEYSSIDVRKILRRCFNAFDLFIFVAPCVQRWLNVDIISV